MTKREWLRFKRQFPTKDEHRLYLCALVRYFSVDRGLGRSTLQQVLGLTKKEIKPLLPERTKP